MTKTPVVPISEWVQQAMPPIDVLMVWHAYLLNPSWYAEDTIRRPELRGIYHLRAYLIQAIVRHKFKSAMTSLTRKQTLVKDISQWQPSAEHQDLWLQRTGTLFDPLESAPLTPHHVINECPKCFKPVAIRTYVSNPHAHCDTYRRDHSIHRCRRNWLRSTQVRSCMSYMPIRHHEREFGGPQVRARCGARSLYTGRRGEIWRSGIHPVSSPLTLLNTIPPTDASSALEGHSEPGLTRVTQARRTLSRGR